MRSTRVSHEECISICDVGWKVEVLKHTVWSFEFKVLLLINVYDSIIYQNISQKGRLQQLDTKPAFRRAGFARLGAKLP